MMYRISSKPEKGDARTVEIVDGETVLHSFEAEDLKAVHKSLKQASEQGWQSIVPSKAPKKAKED